MKEYLIKTKEVVETKKDSEEMESSRKKRDLSRRI